jgi:hypothetical protein
MILLGQLALALREMVPVTAGLPRCEDQGGPAQGEGTEARSSLDHATETAECQVNTRLGQPDSTS